MEILREMGNGHLELEAKWEMGNEPSSRLRAMGTGMVWYLWFNGIKCLGSDGVYYGRYVIRISNGWAGLSLLYHQQNNGHDINGLSTETRLM